MLSRARYEGEEDMCSDEEEVGLNFFTVSCARVLAVFKVEDYEGELIEIGKYLSSLTMDESWSKEDFYQIRKKAYKFFLKEGHLWKFPKRKNGTPLRVVCKKQDQQTLIAEFHDSVWAGHRVIWATFRKAQGEVLVAGCLQRCSKLC